MVEYLLVFISKLSQKIMKENLSINLRDVVESAKIHDLINLINEKLLELEIIPELSENPEIEIYTLKQDYRHLLHMLKESDNIKIGFFQIQPLSIR